MVACIKWSQWWWVQFAPQHSTSPAVVLLSFCSDLCFFSDSLLPVGYALIPLYRSCDMNTKLYLLALAYNLNNLSFSPNQRTSFFLPPKNGNKFSSLCPVLTRRRGSNVVECRSTTKGPFSYNNDMCTYDDNAGGYGFVVIEYKHGLPLSLILIWGYT